MVITKSKDDKFSTGVRHAIQPDAANGSLNHYRPAYRFRTVLSLQNNKPIQFNGYLLTCRFNSISAYNNNNNNNNNNIIIIIFNNII